MMMHLRSHGEKTGPSGENSKNIYTVNLQTVKSVNARNQMLTYLHPPVPGQDRCDKQAELSKRYLIQPTALRRVKPFQDITLRMGSRGRQPGR
jgi:hypothetical protein